MAGALGVDGAGAEPLDADPPEPEEADPEDADEPDALAAGLVLEDVEAELAFGEDSGLKGLRGAPEPCDEEPLVVSPTAWLLEVSGALTIATAPARPAGLEALGTGAEEAGEPPERPPSTA